jgi:hypothetical protein
MQSHSFVSLPARIARVFATSRPPRDARLFDGGSIRTRNFVLFIYRESRNEKSGMSIRRGLAGSARVFQAVVAPQRSRA